jgi:hypothetical protein
VIHCPRTGKIRYASEGQAKLALAKIRKRRKRGRSKQRAWETTPHPCTHCGGWHLTSLKIV